MPVLFNIYTYTPEEVFLHSSNLKSPQSDFNQRINGFKSSKLKTYLWTDLSLCYLGDECVVVAVQAGRQDVSVIEEEEEVLVFAASLLVQLVDAGVVCVCGNLDHSSIPEV